MKVSSAFASLAILLATSTLNVAQAGVVRSGTVIGSSTSQCCGLTADKLLDQSGLSAGYVNGVTDFDAYLASNPTALGSSTGTHFPAGYFALAGATVDIDLGGTYTLNRLAMWNDHDYQGVNGFRVFIDDESSFAGATMIGNFSALYGNNDNTQLDYETGLPHQVFDLLDMSGQYVRVVFDSAHQDTYINLNELAFDAGPGGNRVPEAPALWLAGLGLLSAALVRRRTAR